MKKILYCLICSGLVMCGASYGDPDPRLKTPTSQKYVGDTIGDKQAIFTAKDGDKVVTYTATSGLAGERDVVLESDDITNNNAGVLSVNATDVLYEAQNKVLNIPSNNVLTYTNSSGSVSSHHIYGNNSQFADGLVDAGTVNGAVISAANGMFTETASGFLINAAPSNSITTTINLPTKDNGRGYCCKRHNGTSTIGNSNWGSTNNDKCTTEQFNGLKNGEWLTRFGNFDVSGISVCTDTVPSNAMIYDKSSDGEYYYNWGYVATTGEGTGLDNAYTAWVNSGRPTTLTDGYKYCWCKMEQPAGSSWVFIYSFVDSADCARNCAVNCANLVQNFAGFRGAVFGSVAQ